MGGGEGEVSHPEGPGPPGASESTCSHVRIQAGGGQADILSNVYSTWVQCVQQRAVQLVLACPGPLEIVAPVQALLRADVYTGLDAALTTPTDKFRAWEGRSVRGIEVGWQLLDS